MTDEAISILNSPETHGYIRQQVSGLCAESEAERKERVRLGLPAPTYGYTQVVRKENVRNG